MNNKLSIWNIKYQKCVYIKNIVRCLWSFFICQSLQHLRINIKRSCTNNKTKSIRKKFWAADFWMQINKPSEKKNFDSDLICWFNLTFHIIIHVWPKWYIFQNIENCSVAFGISCEMISLLKGSHIRFPGIISSSIQRAWHKNVFHHLLYCTITSEYSIIYDN